MCEYLFLKSSVKFLAASPIISKLRSTASFVLSSLINISKVILSVYLKILFNEFLYPLKKIEVVYLS